MNQIPYPYDRPVFQPVLHSLDSLPVTINISSLALLPGADFVLNGVMVAVANELSRSCTASPVRMFAYNTVSANQWNNSYYRETCQFTANYIVYKRMQGQQISPNDAAAITIPIIVGVIAAGCQPFLMMLDQTTQQKIYKNTAMYKDMTAAIMQLQQNQAGGMMSGMMGGMGNHQVSPAIGTHPALNDSTASPQKEIHTRFGPINTAPAPTQATVPKKKEEGFIHMDELCPGITIRNDIGAFNMDEQKHSMIYAVSNQNNMEDAAGQVLAAIKKQSDRIEEEDGHMFSSEKLIKVFSEDTLYSLLQSEAAMDSNGPVCIHHETAIILDPLFSFDSIDDIYQTLQKCNTFASIAKALENAYRATLSTENPRSRLAAISVIDRWLTARVNQYMASLTPKRAIRCTSFIEDGDQFEKFILNEVGVSAHAEFMTFQTKSIQTWFKENRKDNEVPSFAQDSAINYILLARKVSVTNLTSSLIECGITALAEHRMVKVTEKATPNLYRMLRNACRYHDRTKSTEHIFITLDGLKFQVEEPIYERGVFLLVARG